MTKLNEGDVAPEDLPEGRIRPGDARHSEYHGTDSEGRWKLSDEEIRTWSAFRNAENHSLPWKRVVELVENSPPDSGTRIAFEAFEEAYSAGHQAGRNDMLKELKESGELK